MDVEAYDMLRDLFSRAHVDNMKVLKALIYAQEDILPLYDGVSKKRVWFSDIVNLHDVLLLL